MSRLPRDWRLLDRLFVAVLVGAGWVNVLTASDRQGSVVLNLLVISLMGVSLLWRRDRPLVPVVCCGIGMPLSAAVLTAPPYIFVSIAMMATASYSAGAHLERRQSLRGLALVVLSLGTVVLIFDPSDWFFPIAIFGVVPWLAGRTIRNQTLLARELAEKAELAEHAREEEERRAIVTAEIAADLIVSETTMKTHVARILMKLEVRDRVQAVVLAYESGVVAPGDAS